MPVTDFIFTESKPIPDYPQLKQFLENRVYLFFGESMYYPNLMMGYGDTLFFSYRGQKSIRESLDEVYLVFNEEKGKPFVIQSISIDLHGIEAGSWLLNSINDHFEHARLLFPENFEQSAYNRVLEELFDEGPLNPIDIKAWLFWLQWTGLLMPPLQSKNCPEGDLPLSFFQKNNSISSQKI